MKNPQTRREAFLNELFLAKENKNSPAIEWQHLERAHILGQFYAIEHLRVHLLMFAWSLKNHNAKELLGQIPRIILAIPGSLTGKAPLGNVGGARVGIFQPMEIPEDLKKILDK